ncbi:MAG TPA: RNase adapter RapZ, partial [Steroidobacteraceae bacterium]|nr:RNase adapter RapZ [Steroidobacteraceae bacterium]
MRLVVISGLSGSGKSVALHMLEDLDYYCIDNLPAGMLPALVAHTVQSGESSYRLTAVGVDARNRPADVASVPEVIRGLCQEGLSCDVVFLRADDEALLKRYSETRRRHPLSRTGVSLLEAIQAERRLLEPIADAADLVIDTSNTSVHELRELIRQRLAERPEGRLSILFESFAYRQGVPGDADFVFDVRSLPNPYWEPGLSRLTGRDAPVVEYLDRHASVQQMLGDLTRFLEQWIPEFQRTNRSYLTVAIGCTGGQHRSVYL